MSDQKRQLLVQAGNQSMNAYFQKLAQQPSGNLGMGMAVDPVAARAQQGADNSPKSITPLNQRRDARSDTSFNSFIDDFQGDDLVGPVIDLDRAIPHLQALLVFFQDIHLPGAADWEGRTQGSLPRQRWFSYSRTIQPCPSSARLIVSITRLVSSRANRLTRSLPAGLRFSGW